MTRPNVRQVLLRQLFMRPAPLNRREFAEARAELFPGEENFIRFLRADGDQELAEAAKDILLSLSNKHSLAPPSRLLFNLLSFEEDEPGYLEEGDFVPQDHFVHLAHLYLLGVYLFSYQHRLHRLVSAELNQVKRALTGKISALDRKVATVSSYRLFAKAWTLFVLYHDLAYPLERIPPLNRAARAEHLKPFARISKSLLKDMSLRVLARLLVLKTLLADGGRETLKGYYLDHHSRFFCKPHSQYRSFTIGDDRSVTFEESLADKEQHAPSTFGRILSNWEGAILLREVAGPGALRTLGTVIPDAEFCAVLENADRGIPYALIQKTGGRTQGDERLIWFCDPRSLPTVVFRRRQHFWEDAFIDCRTSPGLAWRYFVKSLDGYNTTLGEILGERRDAFDYLHSRLSLDARFRTRRLAEVDYADDLFDLILKRLSESLGYLKLDEDSDPLRRVFSSYGSAFEATGREVPSIVGGCVTAVLAEALEAKSFSPVNTLQSENRQGAIQRLAEAAIDLLLTPVSPATAAEEAEGRDSSIQGQQATKSDAGDWTLTNRLGEAISENIRESILLEEKIRDCQAVIRETIEKDLAIGEIFREVDLRRATFDLAELVENPAVEQPGDHQPEIDDPELRRLAVEQTGMLDARLKEYGLPELTRLIDEYRPGFARGIAHFVDHGFAAALIGVALAESFADCAERMREYSGVDAPVGVKALRVGFCTTEHADDRWLTIEEEMLRGVISFAIVTHNLYPSGLPAEFSGYRTSLRRTPFSFLALLSDSLQRWDRRALMNQSRGRVGGLIPGRRFGLEVGERGFIDIWLSDEGLDIKKEFDRLRGTLEEHLEDASSLIRLELSQLPRLGLQ